MSEVQNKAVTSAVTVIQSENPARVAKEYSKVNGAIQKSVVAHVSEGVVYTVPVHDADAMVNLLKRVTDLENCVICPGVWHGSDAVESFRLVNEKTLADILGSEVGKVPGGVVYHDGEAIAARLKRGIDPSVWLLLDCDNPPGMPDHQAALGIKQRLEYLEAIAPGISTCERIEVRSSSNRVINGSGSKPMSHAWVRVSDPAKIQALKAHIAIEMVRKGLSFTYQKKSRINPGMVVGNEARTVIDLAVLDTGRLVFCSKPILGAGMDGYSVDDAGITIVNKGAGAWDINWVQLPTKQALADYKAKTDVELKFSKNGSSLTVENIGQLTLQTEIVAQGKVKTLGEWLDSMEDGEKKRCESPFRESYSEAAFISKHKGGGGLVHDVGNGTTYKMTESKPLALPTAVTQSESGIGAHLTPEQLSSLQKTIEALPVTKDGKVLPSYTSMVNVIQHLGVSYDQFLDQPMIMVNGVMTRFSDHHYVDLAMKLEEMGFGKVPSTMKDCVRKSMMLNQFDSAIEWLKALKWDGVDRCTNLMDKYFGVKRSEYSVAVSLYITSAMAGRVLEPGVKVDMVPILVGAQGIGKTSAVTAMAPMLDMFTEIDLSAKGDDLSRQLRGKLIGELGELRGLKTKDAESIKAWVTRTHEEWTPKFVEFSKVMPRRCVFFGTTNDEEFLVDTTGNRRWLPIDVDGSCDVEGIIRDREQIWAQAAHLFNTNGVMWREAEMLAEALHDGYMIADQYIVEVIERTIAENPDVFCKPLKGSLIIDAIYGDGSKTTKVQREAIGAALRKMGFTYKQQRVGGVSGKFWIPPNHS